MTYVCKLKEILPAPSLKMLSKNLLLTAIQWTKMRWSWHKKKLG